MPTLMRNGKSFFAVAILSLLAILLVAVAPFDAAAQSDSASVSGRVTDQQNAVVPNVEVEMRNVDTNSVQLTKTNGDGIYNFASLRPGNYIMSVRKEQFQTVSVTGITLHVQDSLSRNFVLQVGSSAVSVTVSAADVMWATTDSPAVSTVVTREFVENMPLNGRSFQDLIALAPGTVTSNASGSNDGRFSINGQRDDSNYYMVDGVSANIDSNPFRGAQGLTGSAPGQTALGTTQALLSVDAMEEFRIQTSGYTAEYGRQPGGEVQLTSRSGTNDWHGTAFDYLRNTVFDANNWFANANGIPREPEHQNDFGGTIGGPLRIPKVYNGKDRTFFFFSYEGLRLLLPNFSKGFYPTTQFRQFAAPGVQPFLNAYPIPNGPNNTTDGCTVNPGTGPQPCDGEFTGGFSNPSNLDSVSIRLDHNIGSRIRLFGRYSYVPSSLDSRQSTPSVVERLSTNVSTITLGATGLVGSSILNDFRFGYSASNTRLADFLTNFGGAAPFASSLIVPPQFVSGEAFWGLSNICIPHSSLCPGLSTRKSVSEQHQYNVTDSMAWTLKNHVLKFGFDYRRLLPVYGVGSYQGALAFDDIAGVRQGLATDDFVSVAIPAYPRFTNLSLYAQDHWKATPRLTLDYGLRWEFNPPPTEANGLTPVAITQASDLSNLQLAPAGTSTYQTRYRNFAPRVGFAWNVRSSSAHPIVLRGGFGIYYDTGQSASGNNYSSSVPPFGASIVYTDVQLPLVAAAVAPPPVLPVSSLVPPYEALYLTNPKLRLPYTEQYNLSADFGLAARNALTISYVGNQGHQLLATQVYLALPNFDLPNITSNEATSNYNALQIQDRGYLAPHLQWIASYTWAHAIDNLSTTAANRFTPVRGNSDNDFRHVFTTALNYEVPGSSQNRFVKALTQGWLVANRFTAQSGAPFDVLQGLYILPTGQVFNIYPDLVAGVPLYRHDVPNAPGGWQLNSGAFAEVPLNPDGSPVRTGTLPRNFLKEPGFWSLNSAVQRSFPIHDTLHLIFRAEAFNILNHPNFTSIDNSLGDPDFGQAGGSRMIGAPNQLYGTGAPRSWQFMLKLQF